MRREYEVFEKFPDGSTLFRACVSGKFETQRTIQMLAEHSESEFYAIDIQAVGMNSPYLPLKDGSLTGRENLNSKAPDAR